MPTLERTCEPLIDGTHAHLILPALPQSLHDVPFHEPGPLTRWLMAGGHRHPDAQTHVAVHQVSARGNQPHEYCRLHTHTVPELNLILPVGRLSYELVLGDERYDVDGPASVFIPAGLPHSANVKSGTGFYVAIVFGVQDYADAFAPGDEPLA
jgi:hypothetical protein